MGTSAGGISIAFLVFVFLLLWVLSGKHKRKQEEHLRKLRMNRKAQLKKLKEEKRAEQDAEKAAAQD